MGQWLDSAPGPCPSTQCAIASAVSGQKTMPVLNNNPHSSDFALCTSFVFPKLKYLLKGTNFQSLAVTELLGGLSQNAF
jgi:hypothetical protein